MADNTFSKEFADALKKAISANNAVKTVESGTLLVKGHLLKWKDVAIQISNISSVTISEIPPTRSAFGIVAERVGFGVSIVGAAILFLGDMIGLESGLGISLLIAGLILYAIGQPNPSLKKALNIQLSSGERYSIIFKDESFMSEVFQAFTDIFENGGVVAQGFSLNIENCKFINSPVLNSGTYNN